MYWKIQYLPMIVLEKGGRRHTPMKEIKKNT